MLSTNLDNGIFDKQRAKNLGPNAL